MSRRRKQRAAASAKPVVPPPAGSKPRLWLFRLLAAVAVPVLFLGLLEAGLRLSGFGVSSRFLEEARIGDREVFIPNLHVAERFFGRQMARQPHPFMVDRVKPPGTVRIVVFGESAAYGDPDPDFGLSRVLRVLLEHRYPGCRFEVVNAAMTGINSHAILPIARDCVRLGADAWVVYMGNNEVVGPYGAGTVFGPQVPALPLIRGSLALKATRTGQLLDAIKERLNPPPAQRSEWGGMTMFIDHQVALDDPRMQAVHANFERNLRDILDVAAGHRIPVVLSTVAVNLRDCAPFASLHRAGIGTGELAAWNRQFSAGCNAEQARDWAGALADFAEAAAIDDRSAEIHFRMGRCLLALGRDGEAAERLRRARDLDALRFRCDGPMNEIVRAAARTRKNVVLADADRVLNAASPGGVAGGDLFHEHVHLRYEGNYLLARTLAEQLIGRLPTDATRPPVEPWLSAPECAQWLALGDWNRHGAALTILGRINDPPFTLQADHAGQLQRLAREIQALEPSTRPEALRSLGPMYRRAVEAAPQDPVPESLWAATLSKTGDAKAAVEAARRGAALDPFDAAAWLKLGHLCNDAGLRGEAIADLEKALRRDPGNYWAGNSLGQVLASQKRYAEAAAAYAATLRERPHFGPAHLGLGAALESLGRTNEARQHFADALRFRVLTPDALAGLARFCFERGRYAEAATNFLDAIRLDPADATLHLNLGRALKMLDRADDARRQNAEALRLDPASAEAQFLVGLDLARAGDEKAGAEHFAEAVRLRPGFVEARMNHGLALYHLGRPVEALEQFEAALKLDPTNESAQKFVASLRGSGK